MNDMIEVTQNSVQPTMAQQKVELFALVKAEIFQMAGSLAERGVSPEKFFDTMQAALLHSPTFINASMQDIKLTIRKCCRDNLIPDGDQAALYVGQNGKVTLIPMVNGIRKAMFEATGAHIQSGVIYDGDDFEAVQGDNPSVSIKTSGTALLRERDPDNIAGAWCLIEVYKKKYLTVFTHADITRCQLATNKKEKDGPWEKHRAKMVEKSCVKSAVWQLRYLVSSKNESMITNMFEDDAENYANDVPVNVTESEGEGDILVGAVPNNIAPNVASIENISTKPVPADIPIPKTVKRSKKAKQLEPSPVQQVPAQQPMPQQVPAQEYVEELEPQYQQDQMLQQSQQGVQQAQAGVQQAQQQAQRPMPVQQVPPQQVPQQVPQPIPQVIPPQPRTQEYQQAPQQVPMPQQPMQQMPVPEALPDDSDGGFLPQQSDFSDTDL